MNYDSESEKKAYEQLDQILERAKKSGSITFNEVDFMHLTKASHKKMADLLANLIPTLL